MTAFMLLKPGRTLWQQRSLAQHMPWSWQSSAVLGAEPTSTILEKGSLFHDLGANKDA